MDSIPQTSGSEADLQSTPMMAQYLEIKRGYPDALLLYRMGDFYEMFFDDAEKASATLGIALTKRGKHRGVDIPMCGVPVHALDQYLQKLIRFGHRAAIAEQMEDPAEAKKRGYKSVVARDVVRLITPGTLTEDALLDSSASNHLACLTGVKSTGELALAYADISTGKLAVLPTDSARLAADLARLAPSEILVNDAVLESDTISSIVDGTGTSVTRLPASRFDSTGATHILKAHFAVESLDVFGDFRKIDLAALGALLDYIRITQVGHMPHLRPPRLEKVGSGLLIDPASRANLELSRTLGGERRGSLLACLDETVTAAGARLLAEYVSAPLAEAAAINARLDAVDHFFGDETLNAELRVILKRIPDLERALSRMTSGRGGPRDLAAIASAIVAIDGLKAVLRKPDALTPLPQLLAHVMDDLHAAPLEMAAEIRRALADELPLLARDGGFIAEGYDAQLDENRKLRDDTRQVIANLQANYAEASDVKALKIKHNNVLGYFIEVTAQQAEILRSCATASDFIHRQTIASAVRFTTVALGDLEQKIALAGARVLALELDFFNRLAAQVVNERGLLSQAAAALAALDVFSALAHLARESRYVKPIVDASLSFDIASGRHPVVENALRLSGERAFSPNDSDLSEDHKRLWLLTGPNMAGKSTYLRQNALIAIMAQMGSFVPAASVHIGVLDRLYSRVGAADDLARGRSTFMVEMIETATILNQATSRSLVILDEIGRGTATYDGLSIAWATLEHLHDVNQSRALFATHYHELTSLAATLKQLHCATMKVREWNGDIIFLHEVVPGTAGRSYGIQVAQLAGLPPAVIQRASEVLKRLEQGKGQNKAQALAEELPLFAASVKPASQAKPDGLRLELGKIAPDELSPREALSLLYELKQLAQKSTRDGA
ncbi:DNA mismatch repair protein MutS [Aestuariivirga litoralis]|uniref:DNA mismatch repair protein MutS n=1 Tax=Aestuariivirga litoralis TaxID=2650924 RepID=UPI0018C84830|nr:DNA mismatch repair protein MutS [Aestuariivirga litoralis]MBG1233832.1 DNA mismatch repair protein MutS [Aestuariivirga litoralis]